MFGVCSHFFSLNLSIRSSISRNVCILVSCTSFIIISLALSEPSRNCNDKSSAYLIQTQFAHPDIQQFVGGGGIYSEQWIKRNWMINSNQKCFCGKSFVFEIFPYFIGNFVLRIGCRCWVVFWTICRCTCIVCAICWSIVRKSNGWCANRSVVNCILQKSIRIQFFCEPTSKIEH